MIARRTAVPRPGHPVISSHRRRRRFDSKHDVLAELVRRAVSRGHDADPRLTALWLEQMQTFTDATMAQISAEPATSLRLAGQDVAALASALTWLGERLYYLAAIGAPPFDDQDTLVETLLFLWTSALAGPPGPVSR
jgi:TetR/AcrR family transcriptional regulator, ethionamide resistance regulator